MQLRLPLLQFLQLLLPAFVLLTPVGSAAGTAGSSFNSAFVGKPPCCYVPLLFSVRCLSLARHRHRSQRAPNTASTRRVTRERPCGRGPWLRTSSPVGQQQRKTSNPSRSRSSVGSTRPMGLGGDGRRINLMQKEKKTSQGLRPDSDRHQPGRESTSFTSAGSPSGPARHGAFRARQGSGYRTSC
jgi:hypothetical protein